MDNPFATVPHDAEGIIALVMREAREECPPGACLIEPVLDLWESPIKTFVPLLALRRVRCCIRSGTCTCGTC
jgi:hypothetical protein